MGKILNDFLILTGLKQLPKDKPVYIMIKGKKLLIPRMKSRIETTIHTVPKEYLTNYKT